MYSNYRVNYTVRQIVWQFVNLVDTQRFDLRNDFLRKLTRRAWKCFFLGSFILLLTGWVFKMKQIFWADFFGLWRETDWLDNFLPILGSEKVFFLSQWKQICWVIQTWKRLYLGGTRWSTGWGFERKQMGAFGLHKSNLFPYVSPSFGYSHNILEKQKQKSPEKQKWNNLQTQK